MSAKVDVVARRQAKQMGQRILALEKVVMALQSEVLALSED